MLKLILGKYLEWWLYTLQNLNQLQEVPPRLKGDVIEKAFEKAEFINLPKEEQDKYHKNLKVYRDLINSVDTAHAKGKVEGKIGGKIEGKREGKIEGKREEKIEIAKKSLSENIDVATIALITGLSNQDIEALKS